MIQTTFAKACKLKQRPDTLWLRYSKLSAPDSGLKMFLGSQDFLPRYLPSEFLRRHMHLPPSSFPTFSFLQSVFLGSYREGRTTVEKQRTHRHAISEFTLHTMPSQWNAVLSGLTGLFLPASEIHYRWLRLEAWWLEKWGITWSFIILIRILWGREKAYAIILIFFF